MRRTDADRRRRSPLVGLPILTIGRSNAPTPISPYVARRKPYQPYKPVERPKVFRNYSKEFLDNWERTRPMWTLWNMQRIVKYYIASVEYPTIGNYLVEKAVASNKYFGGIESGLPNSFRRFINRF